MENYIDKIKRKYTLQESKDSVKNIVKPTFLRLSLGGVIEKFDSVSDDYKTDWSKLFFSVNKNKNILKNLIKGLFGTYGGSVEYLIDLDTTEMSPKDVTMVFAGTRDKKQQNALVKVFKESLGKEYIVELFNGDETTNREAEELAKGVVANAKREGKKVVFISKNMASRSFSISEIDTVLLMFDRGSFATISQKISRVLTPGKTYHGDEKTDAYVISLSLDPNREEVNPIDEYIVYESEKVDTNELSDGIKRVLQSVNIFTNGDGVITPIIMDEYADKLISSSSLIKLGKSSTNPDTIIQDGELVELMSGIVVSDTNSDDGTTIEGIDSTSVNKTKGEEKTEKEKKKEEDKEKKQEQNIRQKIKEQLESIVDNIVEISEINNCKSNDIIETLDMIKEKGLEEEVVFEVDMGCESIKKVILLGGVSHKLLNTIITSYNNYENSLVSDDLLVN